MNLKITTLLSLFSLLFSLLVAAQVFAGRGLTIRLKGADQKENRIAEYTGSYALLIGQSGYHAGWDTLESVPGEIARVEQLLKGRGFQVETHHDLDGKSLEEAFSRFIKEYGYDRDNRLLFFYSGHGYSRRDGTRGYLVPVDAPNPLADEKGFLRTALSMSKILSWSREMEAKHGLFLFDSCFSGVIFKTRSLPDLPPALSRLTASPVRQYISAGSAGEEVPAVSTFTPAFIDGLEHGLADLNRDGFVSGTELGLYLRNEVPLHADQHPQFGKIRDYDLSRGDFVFVAGDARGTDQPSQRPEPVSGKDQQKVIMPKTEKYKPQQVPTPWKEPVSGMEFIFIQGGCFQMGERDGDGQEDEHPVHLVCVDDFYMGRYEMTQGEYHRITSINPSHFKKGDNYPVEWVSYNDAQTFIRALNIGSAKTYRLPTEAEWEYAAREGGRRVRFSTGLDTIGAGDANFDARPEQKVWYSRPGRFRESTTSVGSFPPNSLGIYDMAGNVWEWCSDWYDQEYYQSSPRDNPQGALSGTHRVWRGGGWDTPPWFLRAANRTPHAPGDLDHNIGIRLVFSASDR